MKRTAEQESIYFRTEVWNSGGGGVLIDKVFVALAGLAGLNLQEKWATPGFPSLSGVSEMHKESESTFPVPMRPSLPCMSACQTPVRIPCWLSSPSLTTITTAVVDKLDLNKRTN